MVVAVVVLVVLVVECGRGRGWSKALARDTVT